jgi:tetratricopeptide (TPR) repeat protein
MKEIKIIIFLLFLLSLKVNAQNPIDSLMHVEGVKQFRLELMRAQSAKDYSLCLKIVDSLIAMEPNNGEFYFKKGYYNKKSENFDLYLEFINKSMTLGYDSIEVYKSLYLSYSIKKDYDKSLFYAKEMVRMRPNDADLYINVANVFSETNDWRNHDKYMQIAADKGSERAKQSIERMKKAGTWQKYDN